MMPDSESESHSHNGVEAPQPQNTTSGEGTQSPPSLPPQAHIQPAPHDQPEAYSCRPDQTPPAKYFLEVFAVIIGLAYTIAAYRQLGAINGQIGEMKASGKQTEQMLYLVRQQLTELHRQAIDTHDLATEAKEQAQAAKDAANAATQANQSAHDALTRSNRPWIGVDALKLTSPVGFIKAGNDKDPTYFIDGSVEVNVKNYGNSPGLSVNIFVEGYDTTYSKYAFDPKEPFAGLRKFGEYVCAMADGNEYTKKNPAMYGGSLFPSQITIYDAGIAGFSKLNLQPGQFMQVIGCISYRDQFGEMVHHTHYCWIAPVGKIDPLHNCPSNNYAD